MIGKEMRFPKIQRFEKIASLLKIAIGTFCPDPSRPVTHDDDDDDDDDDDYDDDDTIMTIKMINNPPNSTIVPPFQFKDSHLLHTERLCRFNFNGFHCPRYLLTD